MNILISNQVEPLMDWTALLIRHLKLHLQFFKFNDHLGYMSKKG